MPDPSIGRIVHYQLTQGDVDAIHHQRRLREQLITAAAAVSPTDSALRKATSWQFGFSGNACSEGDIYPAMIVRIWPGSTTVQLRVLLDGGDDYWATSRSHSSHEDGRPEFGRWSWPHID